MHGETVMKTHCTRLATQRRNSIKSRQHCAFSRKAAVDGVIKGPKLVRAGHHFQRPGVLALRVDVNDTGEAVVVGVRVKRKILMPAHLTSRLADERLGIQLAVVEFDRMPDESRSRPPKPLVSDEPLKGRNGKNNVVDDRE